MPRKAFMTDLQEAAKSFSKVNVSNIKAGEDDGQVSFQYEHEGTSAEVIALVPDLGEYPGSHTYMFFTNSDNVDPSIHGAVDSMSDCSTLNVSDMLVKVVRALDKATAGSRLNPVNLSDGAGDPMALDSDSGSELHEEPDDAEYDSDDEAWSSKPPKIQQWGGSSAVPVMTADQKALRVRLRDDLRTAKDAGFRICHVGNLINGGKDGFVMLSIRVSKLGISEEALDAWHMDPIQYFLVLIRYTSGYQSFDDLIGNAPCSVQIRVGLSAKYKISIDEAVEAFAKLEDKGKTDKLLKKAHDGVEKKRGLRRLFIGGPLEELLNDRLVLLARYRMAMGFPWLGAEDFFNDHQGRNLDNNAPDARYWAEENIKPGITTQDHLRSPKKEKSFPLVTMQYALRHLVRCTEFCLVCHCKVEVDFEALKPYVCSKPLCLYQYMSLGFGPSIEHEIITQPHVVDLLVSFCYISAYTQKMKYLPTGMALMVPHPEAIQDNSFDLPSKAINGATPGPMALAPNASSRASTSNGTKTIPVTYKAKFNEKKMELLFPVASAKAPLQVGSWISISPSKHKQDRMSCRVIETIHPAVRLGKPVTSSPKSSAYVPPQNGTSAQGRLSATNRTNPYTPRTTPPVVAENLQTIYRDVEFVIFDQNFDDLQVSGKYSTICLLLETLPSIAEMKKFLLGKGSQEANLRQWADHINPAALGLLRWIIASNRSCIVQVDNLEGVSRKSEERVSGMPGWMQFRFAQGAPDKEQRFVTSIRKTTPNTKFPTLFAWHGSPLHNWHGIVREGLHFERTDNGRAYGNGCYHALDVQTSISYSGFGSHWGRTSNGDPYSQVNGQWPHSQLCITQALALNEIVNAPSQFVSNKPYLVVAQLDWIQSRYLFVKCSVNGWQIPDVEPKQVYTQDPNYHALGVNKKQLILPLNAVSKARRPKTENAIKSGNKKVKMQNAGSLEEDPIILSDDTDAEDIAFFFSDEDQPQSNSGADKGKGLPVPPKSAALDNTKTDFMPGTLNATTLQLLEPPSYATSIATKALQRELQATIKTQESHPLHELGWYVDPNLISTVYQWIVELHSFESNLPIAQDMKKKGIKSVVIEIRFGAQYPMSPPFIRVIRPRFLSFMHGGGGHVTMGGALCMELLTNSGWSAVSNIESVLLQVRLAMSSTDPKPARLDQGPVRDYSMGEAVEAFARACNAHGWEVPADFKSISTRSVPSLGMGVHTMPR